MRRRRNGASQITMRRLCLGRAERQAQADLASPLPRGRSTRVDAGDRQTSGDHPKPDTRIVEARAAEYSASDCSIV